MVDKEVLLEFGGATRQAELAIEILGFPWGSNEWLVAADIINKESTLTPDQVNWYYSDAVDRSYVNVPEDYRGGLLKLKELSAIVDFDRVRLSLVRLPWAKQELNENESPQLVRCRFAANQVSLSLQNSAVKPIKLLGEINR